MKLEIGVVCGQCDAYSSMGAARCSMCGHDLSLEPKNVHSKISQNPPASLSKVDAAQVSWAEPASGTERQSLQFRASEILPVFESVSALQSIPTHDPQVLRMPNAEPASWGHETTGKIPKSLGVQHSNASSRSLTKEELMEQARNYVCRSCSTPVPSGHKFCGRCGVAVPPDVLTLREEYYGSLQTPGRATLTVIRADGDPSLEGLTFALNAQEHIVGREGHLTFPEDPLISPRHANLFYRDRALFVRDEGSLNGLYVRVRNLVEVKPGDMFLAGEQVFRIDATPKATDHIESDGTYFWSSPKRPSPFRITQILRGGADGMVICAHETGIAIGREGGEMNFPTDVYMSATHCRIEADPAGTTFRLIDLNSRNGTYLRVRNEQELHHGDYMFLGKKIVRIEISN